MSEEVFDNRTRIAVEFELHELLSLCVLYEQAPSNLALVDDEGVWYGGSVDLAYMRIAEALARFTKNGEMLMLLGARRSEAEQERAGD